MFLCNVLSSKESNQQYCSVNYNVTEKKKGHRLNATVLRHISAGPLRNCLEQCLLEMCCRGVNYKHSVAENGKNCELLHQVQSELLTMILIEDKDYDYHVLYQPPRTSTCLCEPCGNNGNCSKTTKSCICIPGFTGRYCEADVDECLNNPCHQHATCTNTFGSYICKCKNKFSGNGTSCTAYCGVPSSPFRGYTRSTTYAQGSTVTFHCSNPGEIVPPPKTATCQADGTWSNQPLPCGTYQLRLQGTGNSKQGRLEIYHPSYGWSTVCDDSWDIEDGHVACRQLGYSRASAVHHRAHYGEGKGKYIRNFPHCSGSESFLWNCRSHGNRWITTGCGHYEDVSVDCL